MPPEGPDETDADLVDDGEGDTADEPLIDCPACAAPIWPDSERCPRCGQWLTPGERAKQRRPGGARTSWILIALIGLLIVGLLLITL